MNVRSRDASKTALRALMKNGRLSKVIRDGINSQPGSTSRKRAQQVLNVLRRSSMDGAGGPGINRSTPRKNVPYTTSPRDYSNMVIFNGTPKPRIPIGKKMSPMTTPVMDQARKMGLVADGAGGPGDPTGLLTGDLYGRPNQQPVSNTSSGVFGGLVDSVRTLFSDRGNANVDKNTYPGMAQGTSIFPQQNYPFVTGGTPQQQSYDQYLKENVNTGGALSPQQSSYFRANPIPGVTQQNVPQATSPGTTGTPSQAPQQQTPQQQVTAAEQAAQGAQTQAYQQLGVAQQPAQATGVSQMYPGIQTAVDANMGSSAFALNALSSPDYLKGLPGFENMPDETLQGGATLSGRIQKLDNVLRQNYHLDELLNQYQGTVSQGVGLEGRLTDYIRGRDQFLNETSGMLEDFKDRMLTMNLADPETRKSAEMYSNYLYELRGRQNKRYIEFLNSSVDEYNSQLQSTSNMYTTALDNYQRELTTKSAITQEEYGLMFGALTEMYNNVADAPRKALEMQKLQAELYAAQVAASKDLADLYGTNDSAYLDVLGNLKQAGVITSDGKLSPDFSHTDLELWDSLGVADPANYFSAIMNVGRSTMTAQDKDGNYPSLNEVLRLGGNTLDMIWNLNQVGQLGADQAFQYSTQVQDNVANALYNNGIISSDNAEGIKAAVNYLSASDQSYIPFNLGGAPSREQFITQGEKQQWGLSREFLDTLYTDFEGYGNQNRAVFAKHFLEDQNGLPLDDAAVASRLTYSFAQKLGRGQSPGDFQQVEGDTNQASANRPQRNNNPLNIKYSTATSTYQGVSGVDPVPAQDGGQFIVFNTPQDGFNAATRLLKTSGYMNLTVDQAMKRWSNNGYGGEVAPSLAARKINSLTKEELNSLVQSMAQREGYYA